MHGPTGSNVLTALSISRQIGWDLKCPRELLVLPFLPVSCRANQISFNLGCICPSLSLSLWRGPKDSAVGRFIPNGREGENVTHCMTRSDWGYDGGRGGYVGTAGNLGRHSVHSWIEGMLLPSSCVAVGSSTFLFTTN